MKQHNTIIESKNPKNKSDEIYNISDIIDYLLQTEKNLPADILLDFITPGNY